MLVKFPVMGAEHGGCTVTGSYYRQLGEVFCHQRVKGIIIFSRGSKGEVHRQHFLHGSRCRGCKYVGSNFTGEV
jgi:hypothetical protein